MEVRSWGLYPRVRADSFELTDVEQPLPPLKRPMLAHGLGRSYGDVCLVDSGTHILTRKCSRILAFDESAGTLSCEPGASLHEVIERVSPGGWFPPVVPGTMFVTVGGAVANDIHGKNHHLSGTFGAHVERISLRRTSGELLQCSTAENPGLFRATIGGLGLTGVITRVDFKLARMPSNAVRSEATPFQSLPEFMELSNRFADRPYIVGWLDCLAPAARAGRGVLFVGSDAPAGVSARAPSRWPAVPTAAPGWLLNSLTARAFNTAYRLRHGRSKVSHLHRDSFFFPLDAVPGWNLLYGAAGFLQWQCVVPARVAVEAISGILSEVRRSGEGAYLGVIKVFGDRASPGMLSFPAPGVTLAMDFPIRGRRTFALCDRLDAILLEAGGRLYAAKDARMSPAMFRQSNPRLAEFLPHRDPGMGSRFWQRVMGQ